MSAMLKRRLAKIEDVLKPKPDERVTVLTEPGQTSTEEEREKYRSELEAAEIAGDRIFIIRLSTPGFRPFEETGRTVFGSDVEAQIAAAAAQPSKNGNSNGLEDVLQGLSGNVIKTVQNPSKFV
jgi:hypothetical protein